MVVAAAMTSRSDPGPLLLQFVTGHVMGTAIADIGADSANMDATHATSGLRRDS
jgi:hypothetical protein